ncbi:hypothetical protein DMH04_40250 [Kibdelosporangium aridum]|uniref:Uncharacterized protein n=1 Tax=Kibdelosporangium aridum TaxID=2030 RepID=A0A428YWD9_KIBAR|nr:hypothetical protein [Kibdelosporangium aridum]RSM74375.1 hypothetical protein DMH04_40250 [Kibdelosporangium aridum]
MRKLFGVLVVAGLLVFSGGTAHAAELHQWRSGTNLCMEAGAPGGFLLPLGKPCRYDRTQWWTDHNLGNGYWMLESSQHPGQCVQNTSSLDKYYYTARLMPCDAARTLMHWTRYRVGTAWHWKTREFGGRCLRATVEDQGLLGGVCDTADTRTLWTASLIG